MTLKTCPTPDELQQLLLGKIGSEAAEWLEEHLLSCDQCVARAETLGTHDDLTSAIRARKILEGNEEVVAKVVDNLDRLYDSIDTTSSCDTKSGNDQSAASGSKPSAHDVASFLAPAEQPDEIGRLGSYRVLEVLGIGGMGVVFRAEDPHLKRQIALKAMKPELAATPSAKERFLREARSAAAIEHDNIVTIYQVGEDRGVPFLAMRFLRGESLQTRLKREKQLPIEEVLRIGRETASGLAAAHARGLIHRDIKPDNMWLESRSHLHSGNAQGEGDSQELSVTSQSSHDATRTQSDSQFARADQQSVDRVKIVDFGLVRADDDIELTKTGVVMGTPKYMSPEQAQGQPVDHRSDLFSLGSVLYHLTTGEGPFDRGNMPSTLMAVIREDPDRIENHRSDAPRELKGLIVRLLEKNPDDRPQSAAEVVAAIREIESKLSDKTKPAIPKREPRVRPAKAPQAKKSGTRRRVVIGAAIVAPLLIVLGIVLLLPTPDGTLRIEVNDENLEVLVDGEQITLTDKQWEGKKKARKHRLAIKLGDQTLNIGSPTVFKVDGGNVDHHLSVKLGGVALSSSEFEVVRGDKTALTISLERRKAKISAPIDANAPPLAVAPFDEVTAEQHQQTWAKYLSLPVEKEFELPGGEKMTFMLIPPGEFMMGSTDEEQALFLRDKKAARAITRSSMYYLRDEVPQHRVRITRPFYLGMCEVTQAQWQALMGSNPSNFQDHLTHPVEQVSWDDIQPFLAKLNEGLSATEPKFALPTEAHWEFACRAGTIETWHIGDSAETLNEVAWFADNSYDSTHPVGRLKPNSFGLHDMHGNVGEWCADWHAGDYYSKTPADDPAGPPRGSYRVTRGGGYIARAAYCRSAIRHGRLPGLRYLNLGFRLAMTIDPPTDGLRFAGDPSHVRVPTFKYDGKHPLTIEAIVTPEAQDHTNVVSSFNFGGYTMGIKQGRWVGMIYGRENPAMSANAPLVPRRRTHLALVYDGKQAAFFVDGKLQAREEAVGKYRPPRDNIDLFIGADAHNDTGEAAGSFSGDIHQVRFSKSAVYTENFTAPTKLEKNDDTLALYRLDVGTGNIAHDSSGNNHHGRIHDATWIQPAKLKPVSPSIVDPDRRAAEWVRSINSHHFTHIVVRQNGEERRIGHEELKSENALPTVPFQLTGVHLHYNRDLTDEGLANLRDCRHLTYLHFGYTGIGDGGLVHLKDSCRDLQELHLPGGVTDVGLASFRNCRELTRLSLHGVKASTAGLDNFQHCKKLKSLFLGGVTLEGDSLRSFAGCSELESLDVRNTGVAPEELVHFKDCKKLKHLDISGNPTISNKELGYFRNCKELTSLNLAYANVDDDGLSFLTDCKDLSYLNVAETRVLGPFVQSLSEMLPDCKIDRKPKWPTPGRTLEPRSDPAK